MKIIIFFPNKKKVARNGIDLRFYKSLIGDS